MLAIAGQVRNASSERFAIDNEFDAAIACAGSRALVVAQGIIFAVSQGKELAAWHLVAFGKMVEHCVALRCCKLMVGCKGAAIQSRIIGMALNSNALLGVRASKRFGNPILNTGCGWC